MACRVTVVTVNYNSGGDCARLLRQISAQRGVDLDVVVIDSASRDDSLALAKQETDLRVTFIEPGVNVGYTGNNLALATATNDVFLVNPDVEITDPDMLTGLVGILHGDPALATVAPHIVTEQGIEYTDSVIDFAHAHCHHVGGTLVPGWPHSMDLHKIAWVNGAAWLIRHQALREVGMLDERFFLFFEEADWCIRAASAGWQHALSGIHVVKHQRSSSFGASTKGSYYYWRNLHLLCSKHGKGWERAYRSRLLRFARTRRHLRNGHSLRALEGWRDAHRGRFGPAREDRESGC